MKMRRFDFTLLFLMSLIGLFTATFNAYATMPPAPSPSLHFNKKQNIENYTGSLMSYGPPPKLVEVRMSLYDVNKKLRETGLLSEYSMNKEYGKYLKFRDVNNNSKLESVDLFIINEKGVSDNWGVILKYESTGDELASSSLSNKKFSIKDEVDEFDSRYNILIFEINVFSLLLILMYIYTRKK